MSIKRMQSDASKAGAADARRYAAILPQSSQAIRRTVSGIKSLASFLTNKYCDYIVSGSKYFTSHGSRGSIWITRFTRDNFRKFNQSIPFHDFGHLWVWCLSITDTDIVFNY